MTKVHLSGGTINTMTYAGDPPSANPKRE